MKVSAPGKKRILLVLRHSPYGSSLARASVDVALATAAFEQELDLLFVGDGILQLLPDQDGRQFGTKTIGRLLSSLPLFDINHAYADAAAVSRFNVDITTAPIEIRPLTALQMQQIMTRYDHLLGF